jgi:hypothetical protein
MLTQLCCIKGKVPKSNNKALREENVLDLDRYHIILRPFPNQTYSQQTKLMANVSRTVFRRRSAAAYPASRSVKIFVGRCYLVRNSQLQLFT